MNRAVSSSVVVLVVIWSLILPSMPANAVTRQFGFDGCSWMSVAEGDPYLTWAKTETWDLNGGCSYLDADLRYYDENGEQYKWCNPLNRAGVSCKERVQDGHLYVDHHLSYSKAKSWETDRWQWSGWWG